MEALVSRATAATVTTTTAPPVQRIATAADMEAQVEDMEAEIHMVAPVRAPLMAAKQAMEAARALTAATEAIRIPTAATEEENLLMEAIVMVARINLMANQTLPLTALSQPLVVMARPEPRVHNILVVTATAAMARVPLQPMEVKARALAMAVPVPSHPLVAMEALLQVMARPPATANPPAMEAPLQAMARAPDTARTQAMEAPH